MMCPKLAILRGASTKLLAINAAKYGITKLSLFLDKIYYIGEQLPDVKDERPKFVILGTPQEFLDSLP